MESSNAQVRRAREFSRRKFQSSHVVAKFRQCLSFRAQADREIENGRLDHLALFVAPLAVITQPPYFSRLIIGINIRAAQLFQPGPAIKKTASDRTSCAARIFMPI